MRRLFILRYLIVAVASIAFGIQNTTAQDFFDRESKLAAVDTITSGWDEWETAGISGKLRMNGLPLSPSVKIFMQRDSCITISLRAPLMGEVGRAEIYGDTLLLVDKMHKTFVRQPISDIMSEYPVTLSDIQNLLLGRAVFPDAGVISEGYADSFEIYREQDGMYSIVPAEFSEEEEFSYGYLFDSEWNLFGFIVIPLSKPETMVGVEYTFQETSYDITVGYRNEEKVKSGTLSLDYPVWDSSPISPLKINKGYRQLDFPDFMKSF